ncbi:alpha-amylase family glycosyl hydrolase [Oceanivirga miroungae]|uniref:Alpha amylase n=1 Tax=Oceanivirga miroungae TaxID=1130046 RepID=A0A6I8MFL6_9FUSO|nr:alpha-amylase family glycosyl hydrolase [Oceanivirga miroungae]VWL85942.1 alpha amylase [Oceanivirga miroungae]
MRRLIILVITAIFLVSCSKKDEDKNRIYYEIFVRSFSDSNSDGIGDLNGISAKLEKLSDLGIEGIWLSPIFKSSSSHKYDVEDYMSVDKEFGTKEDLKNLVKKAHKLNIKVILDFPLNHTSINHPWFKDLGKYKDYYVITSKKDKRYKKDLAILGPKTWNDLDKDTAYYALFYSGMPDLNFDNKEVRKNMIDYAKYWVKEFDIDGYRIDAAMHLYAYKESKRNIVDLDSENIKVLKEFKDAVKSIKNDAYFVGEVWSDSIRISKYYKSLDSNFNFTLSTKLIPYTLASKNSEKISNELEKIYEKNESVNKEYMDAPFLTNHDQKRIASSVNELKRLKLAASILLTLPGNPYIYYGEELGMKGDKPDEHIREGYLWGDNYQTNWVYNRDNIETNDYYTQLNNPKSLLNHYKKWIKIRKDNREIKYGKYEKLDLKDNEVFSYKMKYKGKVKYIIHNLSDKKKTINLDKNIIELEPYESIVK